MKFKDIKDLQYGDDVVCIKGLFEKKYEFHVNSIYSIASVDKTKKIIEVYCKTKNNIQRKFDIDQFRKYFIPRETSRKKLTEEELFVIRLKRLKIGQKVLCIKTNIYYNKIINEAGKFYHVHEYDNKYNQYIVITCDDFSKYQYQYQWYSSPAMITTCAYSIKNHFLNKHQVFSNYTSSYERKLDVFSDYFVTEQEQRRLKIKKILNSE